MTTRIVLWRHGQTDWNAANRVQGQLDTELSRHGRTQAAQAAKVLVDLPPDVIVSSDLRRAADTAAELATLAGLPVAYDVRLRERKYGEWQGLASTEIMERWPEEYARWRAGQPVLGAGVEEHEEMAVRVGASLREIAASSVGRTVVIATHASAARVGTASLLGWPAEVVRQVIGLANCHWTELREDSARGWTLIAHNVGAGAAPSIGAVSATPGGGAAVINAGDSAGAGRLAEPERSR